MGRPAANEDIISGLIMALNDIAVADLSKFDTVTVDTVTLYVAKLDYYEQLKMDYGIEEKAAPADAAEKATNTIVYHVQEFFRMSPTGKLYLAIKAGKEIEKDEIKQLQYYSKGTIRQIGILTETLDNIADYQVACTGATGSTGLEEEHQPLSLIVTRTKGASETLSDLRSLTLTEAGYCNVSFLIGCDLDPGLDAKIGDYSKYGCIGNCLGALSKAMVHESIAWVQKFPLGLSMPGFITGELVKEVSTTEQNLLNDKRLIFVRTHVGISDSYYNDSHTLDLPTSDYAYIENVRTMDKATRGIRTNLLPYLNSPLYVDASSGKLRADTVASLETIAGKALDDMEKAGELSGYKVEIDPEQNVLATSELVVQIKNVPVGVMRMVKIKIGFTTKLN
jgi:hypothetical protein